MDESAPRTKSGGAKGRSTSYDVARLAGVSQSAVSRCFRPGGSVSKSKRERILKAAKKLGYQPNAIASGLITKRSNLVAVLISNLTNLYYPEVLSELTQQFDSQGMRVLLFALESDSDIDAALDQIWRFRADGAVVALELSSEQLNRFHEHGVPVVLYNRESKNSIISSISCDSIAGERLLVDRLVATDHKHFGIIGGPQYSPVALARSKGALDQLASHGLQARVVDGAFDHESGVQGMLKLAAEGPIDAVICANDLMAIGAIDAARHELGLTIPDDVSIVGFDGVDPAAWQSYRLVTIRQPVRRMTEAAVAMLIERIEAPENPAERRTFTGEFIEGSSARI